MTYTPSKFAPASPLVLDGTISQTLTASNIGLTPTVSTNTIGAQISGTTITLTKPGRYFVALEVNTVSPGLNNNSYINCGFTQAGSVNTDTYGINGACKWPLENPGGSSGCMSATDGDITARAGDTLTLKASASGGGIAAAFTGRFRIRFIPTEANPQ